MPKGGRLGLPDEPQREPGCPSVGPEDDEDLVAVRKGVLLGTIATTGGERREREIRERDKVGGRGRQPPEAGKAHIQFMLDLHIGLGGGEKGELRDRQKRTEKTHLAPVGTGKLDGRRGGR